MPAGVIKKFSQIGGKSEKELERLWKKAKALVTKQYGLKKPSKKDGGERFYKLTMGIFKTMAGVSKEESLPFEIVDFMVEKYLQEINGCY